MSFIKTKQIGSKNLYLGKTSGLVEHNVLISYNTIVGYYSDPYLWYLTKKKCSRTTSKQLKDFANTIDANVEWVEELPEYITKHN